MIKPSGLCSLIAARFPIELWRTATKSESGRDGRGRQSPFTGSLGDGEAQLRTWSQAKLRNDSSVPERQANRTMDSKFFLLPPATLAASALRSSGSDVDLVSSRIAANCGEA